ncbi:MAG: hypothetical protein N3A69_17035, partial [Leptospiraceae bacterium]|nr:hypothetical protein [Leptospiraceae bacterium]
VGQVREMWTIPLERFLVLEEVGDGLYKTVPLTSYVLLLPSSAPVYRLQSYGLRLGAVPTWDYLRVEFIEKYTTSIGRISPQELERVKIYVKTTDSDSLKYATRKFISLNSKVWAKWTMASLLHHADLAEEEANEEEE